MAGLQWRMRVLQEKEPQRADVRSLPHNRTAARIFMSWLQRCDWLGRRKRKDITVCCTLCVARVQPKTDHVGYLGAVMGFCL
jgi:hypothetical protein